MIGCTALLSAPHIAMAASTPQQLIDRLSQNKTVQAQSLTGTLNLTMRERAVVRGTKLNDLSLNLRLSQRVLPRNASGTLMDTEGRFTIEKLMASEMPFALEQPLAIQWKYAQDRVFFRVERLPEMLVNYLKGQDVDLSPYIGQWFELDQEVMSGMKELQKNTTGMNQSDLEKLARERAFIAVRVEKRTKDANGDSIARIRARLNPVFINRLLQEELKKLDKKSPDYRANYNAVVQSHQKLAKVLRAMTFVLTVNENKNELNRLEVGGTVTEPRKTCTYNYSTNKDACRTVANTTIQFTAGFSINKDSGAAIELPSNSMKFFEFIGRLSGESLDASSSTSSNDSMMIHADLLTEEVTTSSNATTSTGAGM